MRPTPTALCAYGAADLNRRILSLLRQSERTLEIETVERIFGLPRLYTAYDAPRSADYFVILSRQPGGERWRAMLSFDESFFPTDRARQPRFRGTMRPRRIAPARRGWLQLRVTWLEPREIRPGTGACLAPDALARGARLRGWRVEPVMPLVMDAAPRPRLEITRGRGTISVPLADENPCVTDFDLSIEEAR